MATGTSIQTLIEAIPGVYGGRPRLARSGLPIIQLAAEYQSGMRIAELHEAYPQIDDESLYAGIAYYLLNKAAIDEELRVRDEEGRSAFAEWKAQRA
ncbi:MAG: hypothetical protein C0506_15380, partial [Anaerolinea sp.]|nr:hypothetical protein [Anaerolinea sp.]